MTLRGNATSWPPFRHPYRQIFTQNNKKRKSYKNIERANEKFLIRIQFRSRLRRRPCPSCFSSILSKLNDLICGHYWSLDDPGQSETTGATETIAIAWISMSSIQTTWTIGNDYETIAIAGIEPSSIRTTWTIGNDWETIAIAWILLSSIRTTCTIERSQERSHENCSRTIGKARTTEAIQTCPSMHQYLPRFVAPKWRKHL